jgi:hypothetical protein
MENRPLPSETPDQLADDRRQWVRFLSSVGEVVIRPQGGEQRAAIVVDESFGGIGLVADDGTGLVNEAVVDVTYEGAQMLAVVKYVCPTDDGRVRVGMEWRTKVDGADSVREKLGQFESRLFSLFRLLEIGDWEGLQRAATHLERDAARLEIPALGNTAAELRETLQTGGSKKAITTALERLVDVCTYATK